MTPKKNKPKPIKPLTEDQKKILSKVVDRAVEVAKQLKGFEK